MFSLVESPPLEVFWQGSEVPGGSGGVPRGCEELRQGSARARPGLGQGSARAQTFFSRGGRGGKTSTNTGFLSTPLRKQRIIESGWTVFIVALA